MQPAPSEAFQDATLTQTSINATSVQHGLSTNLQVSDSFPHAEVVGTANEALEERDNASTTSSGTRRGRLFHSRRLSKSTSSSAESSPGSRIEEYEKAHGKPNRRSDGMVFQVVPSMTGKESNVSILDFPNEVLTHILSHLPAESLSLMSLVSHRFHKLVTTPPAWRIAFARYFPGSGASSTSAVKSPTSAEIGDSRKEQRAFTRLSVLASWRSEYILRTRLLRSLSRGRPAIHTLQSKSASRQGNPVPAPAAVITYSSGLLYPVSHIHATFGVGLNKKQPLFMHGAVEQGAVSTSDPSQTRTTGWAMGDFEAFKHFADLYVGEAEFGLGPGNVVGMPNVMDLSQPYGKIYGEACPGGRVYFTSASEQRGRFLPMTSLADRERGIPEVTMTGCAVTSVWIAKSENVLKASNGIFGCLAGFSNGVLQAFALGANPVYDRRFAHGEPTAKWVVSPGVPIIAICIDEKYNARRSSNGRIWAIVLNALGEVFYLTAVPCHQEVPFRGKTSAIARDNLAWETGRLVEWHLVESTRRSAKPDPFSTASVDGSYTPRLSSLAQGLSQDQLVAETKEVEKYLDYKPKYFRSVCDGWDMRRKLLVDFAGDDLHDAGESIFVVRCGTDEGGAASIKRFSHRKTKLRATSGFEPFPPIAAASTLVHPSTIFGSPGASLDNLSSASPSSTPKSRTSSYDDTIDGTFKEDWHISNFEFDYLRDVVISAVATDDSEFAILPVDEDPLLGMSAGSSASSPLASPMAPLGYQNMSSEIPGRRARFLVVGTTAGIVITWNMRATISNAPDIINTVQPSRVIYTKSPQISSLAMTALYVVHGGNDGLVQAWDPLGSTSEPVRTLNSRFSDRARRRIAQAEASVHGVGNNYYAAGAIVLDPDPTVLRGMVSLGTHLRYWHYSASAADAYKSRKRGQLRRRPERGSNAAANEQKFHHSGRTVLKDYIQNEKEDLELEKAAKQKETDRLRGRFGIDLLGEGASEEEILAYATMLSEETFAQEGKIKSGNDLSTASSSAGFAIASSSPQRDVVDAEVEEAIRLSLMDNEMVVKSPRSTAFDVRINYGRGSQRSKDRGKQGPSGSKVWTQNSNDNDLDFALRLSLAEQQSRMLDEEEFPALGTPLGDAYDSGRKGKGTSK